jgi:uncharacterized protein (DUF3820 family)
MSKKLTDDSEMPWGKHKGELMIDVPDDYLVYMYKRGLNEECSVRAYIEDSFNKSELKD